MTKLKSAVDAADKKVNRFKGPHIHQRSTIFIEGGGGGGGVIYFSSLGAELLMLLVLQL